MKSLLLFCMLIASTIGAFADITAYKSKDGIVLVSNSPGQYFTIQIKGSKIEPLGEGSSNPMFMVDGQFIQCAVIRVEDLKAKTSDEAELLKDYLAYETEFYKGHLKDISSKFLKPIGGHPRLTWSATPTDPSSKVRNVFLVFVSRNNILSLSSAVPTGSPEETARKRLEVMAESFKPSDKPITLKFAKDGSYSHSD